MRSMNTREQAQLIGKLSALVSFPSDSSQQHQLVEFFDYLERVLKKYPMHITRYESSGFPSLLATTQHTKKPKLLLQSHVDVVPAKTYELIETDDKLLGRGVYDMKFAAACFFQLLDDLADQLSSYDFGIMLTSDEELGGEHGVGFLLGEGISTEICLLPDGGNDWGIETESNAACFAKLIAKGRTAHGSRPWEGENAIDRIITSLGEIKIAFGSLKPSKCSLTISQIEGGTAMNQVPDYAAVTLDMRFINADHACRKKLNIQKIAKKHGLDFTILAESNANSTDLTNRHVARFIEIANAIHDKPLNQSRSFGGSDARFFMERDITTILMRPTGGGAHSDEEWLDKAEFFQFYELLSQYVVKTA